MAALDLRPSSSLSVFSCAKKLFIENFAASGDAEDILNDKVIESDGGTIIFTIDVRRQFMTGNYVMHIVGPDTSLDKSLRLNYNSAILCREDVDPKLIHELLIDSNCDRNGKHPELSKNFISRYDWIHFRNWGCDDDEFYADNSTSYIDSTCNDDFDGTVDINDEKFKKKFKRSLKGHFKCNLQELTFFINAGRMDDILRGNFTVERDNESVFVIMNNTGPEQVIGFVINTDSELHTFIGGDWHYACLLTDTNSKQNFALIFGDLYLHKYLDNYDGDTASFKYNIQNDQFTYNIENFLYKK